ncbi:MAG: sigma 54-interacting transcriptional regulator [Desulfovibrionaceae bacterium]|nr:sigma 54-interacting transcriptional regulator [Desulfovibrionaceae bacterium]
MESIGDIIAENEYLKEKLAVLERRVGAFEVILDTVPEGYILVGSDETILYINTAYCNYFGVKREDILGKSIYELIPNTKLVEIMEKKLTEVDALHVFPKGLTASGERNVAVTRMAITDENGAVFAAAALIKFSRYTARLVQVLLEKEEELDYYRKELAQYDEPLWSFDNMPSINAAFHETKALAQRFAQNDLSILLQGETGTGKEVFAKAIHHASSRKAFPFVAVNCAAIPLELLESELFGYEEGAFTGGRRKGKRGKLEMADKGTLFLDEIGDMPLSIQPKLLRVLEDNMLEKLGGEKSVRVDVRLVAATHQNLEEKVKKKEFREDLYYRLNTLPVYIPPLRERREDIPQLAYTFLGELNERYEPRREISAETLTYLQQYSWPGNIRELKNVIGYAFMTAGDTLITLKHLPSHIHESIKREKVSGEALKELLPKQESDIIISALRKYNCNCSKAAESLGIHRATLYSKILKYNINLPELRSSENA